ncbi:hypothetical protein [Polymorphospora lycopeni]|uniref:Uncharacterized protein n=1 Tax=Polymorphospora lycopeni TaxID=3140240 RepID=A0ABV5CPB8_9ACTN
MDTATNPTHAETGEDDDAPEAVEETGDRQPWTLPDDDPTPESELSTGGWDAPLPAVDEPEGQRPVGMIAGGVGLGAVIAGLGVFSAFGLAGVAVAAGVAAVAAPVVAVAGSDLRRRVQTGQWRPNAAGTASRTRNGAAANRSAGAAGGRRAAGKAGGGRAGSTGGTGRSRRAATAGARSAGHGRKQPKGGGLFGGKGAGKAGPAKRGLAGSTGTGNGRHRAAGGRPSSAGSRGARNSSVLGRLGKKLTPQRHKTAASRASGARSEGFGQWKAWRKQRGDRAEAKRRARINAAKQRRADRWAKADARTEARRQRWAGRRANARQSAARGARRVRSWVSRPFTASWRRITTGRRAFIQRLRSRQWTSALWLALLKLWRTVRTAALRVPAWLGAPQPTPKQPPDYDDVIDGEIVDDPKDQAPPVARPGRRRPYVMHPPAQIGPALHAPAVPTPRSNANNSSRGARMNPAHEAVVDAFREAIGNWQPPDEGAFEEYESFFSSWEEMLNEMGDVVQGLSERFRDETPVETAVDYLSDLAGGFALMAQAGGEVYNAWRTGNAADIERHENPRPNEQQLNVL